MLALNSRAVEVYFTWVWKLEA